MKENETAKKRPKVNPDTRDTKRVQIELPIDLYNFFHDCYLPMQTMTLDQLITREMMDSARRILEEGLSPAWFDAEAVARKYNLNYIIDLNSRLKLPPESPTSESLLKPNGAE